MTEEDTGWDERKHREFWLRPNDAGFHTYDLEMDGQKYWKGILRQFRLDPEQGIAQGTFQVRAIPSIYYSVATHARHTMVLRKNYTGLCVTACMSESTVHLDQPQTIDTGAVIKVFAVVVVYKLLPSDSPSIYTLLKAADVVRSSQVQLHVRVVDNTPGGQDSGPLPSQIEYRASPTNPGLSKAYNEAWRAAEREGYDWLLTLDQDTHLPETFLQSLASLIRHDEQSETVAAIVPRIVDRGRPVSPLQFAGGFLPLVVPAHVNRRLGKHVLALNSASLLRVSALREVDGYDEAFPLHNSDTRLFQKLDQAGKRVMMATDIVVSHELAIMDRDTRMSGERYRSMLTDERVFWDLHMGMLGRLERMLRLMGRVAKGLLRRENGDFTEITMREIGLRLLTRRKSRVAQLRREPPSWKA